jgi:hypothetical protein
MPALNTPYPPNDYPLRFVGPDVSDQLSDFCPDIVWNNVFVVRPWLSLLCRF